MPRFHASDTMTSVTPPSFVDDGISIKRRVLRGGRWNIDLWLESTVHPTNADLSMTSGSTYTGSFIDDGADMFLPSKLEPSLGEVDKTFYDAGKKVEDKDEKWNEGIGRAVGGAIMRSLTRTRALANMRVVDVTGAAGEKQKSAHKKKHGSRGAEEGNDLVRVRAPVGWGRFIIEDKDGRVVVIDDTGEYDSGLPGQSVPEWGKSKRRQEKQNEKAAPVSTSPKKISTTQERATQLNGGECLKENRKSTSSNRDSRSRNTHRRRTSSLEGNCTILSPTNFFMTGGAAGYPSLTPSPTKEFSNAASAIVSPSRSALGSAIRPVDLWKEESEWKVPSSAVEQLSSTVYHRSSHSTPSQQSGAGSKNKRRAEGARKRDINVQAIVSSPRSLGSHVPSSLKSRGSWKRDVEEISSRVSQTRLSRTFSATKSNMPWNKLVHNYSQRSSRASTSSYTSSDADSQLSRDQGSGNEPIHSLHQAYPSYTSEVTPYSWRREVEVESTYSTHGSSGPRSQTPSVAGTSTWLNDGKTWSRDVDNQSARSHSTYRAPTVEDAPETSEDEGQNFTPKDDGNTNWTGNDSQTGSYTSWGAKDSGNASNSRRSTMWKGSEGRSETGLVGGSQGASHDSGGSGSGGWRDQSGFDEDNETWLNSEVGGVRYREAKWRKAGSWRDV